MAGGGGGGGYAAGQVLRLSQRFAPLLPPPQRNVNDKKFLFNCYGGISFWETSKLDIVREKAGRGLEDRS